MGLFSGASVYAERWKKNEKYEIDLETWEVNNSKYVPLDKGKCHVKVGYDEM